MNCNVILPPFPFPHRWGEVSAIQRRTGERFWTVPDTPDFLLPNNSSSYPLLGTTTSDIVQNTPTDLYDSEEGVDFEYGIELNPVWAERLVATVKKMEDAGKIKRQPVKKLSSVQKNKAKNKRKRTLRLESERRQLIDCGQSAT
eukprot:gene29036-35048_t